MMAQAISKFRLPVYGSSVFILTLLIIIVMSPIFYYLFNNYSSSNFAFGGNSANGVYLLKSESTIKRLKDVGVDGTGYEVRLNEIKKYLSDQEYDVTVIGEEGLKSLNSSDTLFVIDAIALNDQEVLMITRFVQNGGSLVFNHYSGFSRPDGSWRGDALVRDITALAIDPYIHTLKKQAGIFATPRIFSPLSVYLNNGPLLSVVYYDDIPLFKTPSHLKPDMMYTDWTQYAPPAIGDVPLPSEFSGALWHGSFGKGSWIYFNFPSYVFSSSATDTNNFLSLFRGIGHFAIDGVGVRLHPYQNGNNPVFISEDTEFRFENAKGFSDTVRKLKVPSTAFCVSELAERYPAVTRELGENPFIEVGSHSHTHGDLLSLDEEGLNREIVNSKNVLEKLGQVKVTGFRPPREEIHDELAIKLVEAGYEYTMEKNKNHLYPSIIRKELVVISRVGTDDFAFFANHTFDQNTIVKKMKQEAAFINALDGIYTLSVHTHLFSDPHNITVLESILTHLKEESNTDFRQGRDIARRIKAVSMIDTAVSRSNKNYIVSIINNNSSKVSEVVVRLYWPRFGSIQSMKADATGVKFFPVHHSNERYTDIMLYDLEPRKQFSILASYR